MVQWLAWWNSGLQRNEEEKERVVAGDRMTWGSGSGRMVLVVSVEQNSGGGGHKEARRRSNWEGKEEEEKVGGIRRGRGSSVDSGTEVGGGVVAVVLVDWIEQRREEKGGEGEGN